MRQCLQPNVSFVFCDGHPFGIEIDDPFQREPQRVPKMLHCVEPDRLMAVLPRKGGPIEKGRMPVPLNLRGRKKRKLNRISLQRSHQPHALKRYELSSDHSQKREWSS
jgi:hypothetical protein